MFKIYDGRECFYQWDLDRKLIVNDKTISAVHFCNKMGSCSIIRYVYEVNGMYLVDVPNLILQNDFRMNVYGYDANHTKYCETFDIVKRSKPEDYVYTETEVNTFAELDARITAIEEEGVNPDVVASAVEDYLTNNPIETGATAEQVAQINKNTADIEELQAIEFSNFASKTYVDYKIENLDIPEVDLSNYYTKEETITAINDALGVIENGTY